ncbi:MAG: EamA family transporter [Bacteroidaceae bacterium]
MRDIFFLALVPTLVSDFTLILAVQHIGSTTTAVLGCMEPLTAVTMGVFFLGESCNAIQLIGIGIILCAVTIVIIGGNLQAFKRKIKLIPELLLIRRK